MAKYNFHNSKIVGISSVCGDISINIDDEKQYYKTEKQLLRLKKSMGFNVRCITSKDITTYDLCKQATINLLSSLNLTPTDFDAIISITQTPDYKMPGNAHLLHGDLGFSKDCIAIDLELGCSGFVYGLFQAFLMCETFAKRVLLLNGDTLSKIINVKNRIDAPVFGDCGCASIIEHSDINTESFFILKSDGSGHNTMFQKAGGCRFPSSAKTRELQVDEQGNEFCDEDFYMAGGDVFTFTLTEQPTLLEELLEYSSSKLDDIDYFVFHQANKFIVENIANKANIPMEKVPVSNFINFGNQSGASIPATICYELNQNIKNKKLILQGYGIGLSWGACNLKVDNICVLPTVKYKKEE